MSPYTLRAYAPKNIHLQQLHADFALQDKLECGNGVEIAGSFEMSEKSRLIIQWEGGSQVSPIKIRLTLAKIKGS